MTAPPPTLAIFTTTQRRVIYCLATGMSYHRASVALNLSVHTVRRHREHAQDRLPGDFYPNLRGLPRLLMYYALATDKDQYSLVA